ncbi:hypothetical protein V5799_031586 [Amblyomma americanum]|uniref:BPTI/Kunitz inhibitor domain-containing protein n=1 Tax=Amblyomma americanum TaxID=6943 RepID=A0AAQ4DTL1_AMBAM
MPASNIFTVLGRTGGASSNSEEPRIRTDETPRDWADSAFTPRPECTSPLSVVRCPRPLAAWVFSGTSILDGTCQQWEPRSQCLEPGGNAFASLTECQRECANGTRGEGAKDRCGGPVRSRHCRDGDRRLEYVVGSGLTPAGAIEVQASARPRCRRLPPDLCASDGRGFASLEECRETCSAAAAAPSSGSSDPRCRPGAEVGRCGWKQRRLRFYFDQDEARCLPFMQFCLAKGGFPDRSSCVERCLLAPA